MAASFERLDPQEHGTILLYQTADGQTSLDVRLQEETVWLSLTQMAELLDRDKSEISGISGTSFGKGNWSERQLLQKMQQLPQTAKRIRWNFSTWMRSSLSATGSTPSAAPSSASGPRRCSRRGQAKKVRCFVGALCKKYILPLEKS